MPAAAAGSGFGLIRQGCSSASAAQEPPHPCTPQQAELLPSHLQEGHTSWPVACKVSNVKGQVSITNIYSQISCPT